MTLAELISQSDLIFIGKLTKLEPPPGVWSGFYKVTQKATYEVKKVLSGTSPGSTVEVNHLVIDQSKTASTDPKIIGLSTNLFQTRAELMVFAKSTNGAFEGIDAEDDVAKFTPALETQVMNALGGGGGGGNTASHGGQNWILWLLPILVLLVAVVVLLFIL